MLRLSFLALPAAALALLAAGGGSSAPAPPSLAPFEGDWTPTSGALGGKKLTIEPASAQEAKSLVGSEWTNGSGTGWFDKYCGTNAEVYHYLRLEYLWYPQGAMGGCISKKTTPHIIYAGTRHDAGSARIREIDGLGVLTGYWEQIQETPKYNFSAERPAVKFSVVEQGHKALPKNKEGAKLELTKLLGQGAFSLVQEKFRENEYSAGISDATGRIRFHKWRIFEHGVIDEDDLVLRVEPGHRSFYRETDEVKLLHRVGVVVTKVDREETDHCAVGTTGALVLADWKSRKDIVYLEIPNCHVEDSFLNGHKGSKVAANLTLEKP